MKILLITDEEWNDAVLGNNVLTNWFKGYNAEFAQIYCSPGKPFNEVCNWYFQITDMQMVRSIYTCKRAGHIIQKPTNEFEIEQSKQNAKRKGYYVWLKRLSLYINTPMVLLRDAIWIFGRYDKSSIRQFVEDFSLIWCIVHVCSLLS